MKTFREFFEVQCNERVLPKEELKKQHEKILQDLAQEPRNRSLRRKKTEFEKLLQKNSKMPEVSRRINGETINIKRTYHAGAREYYRNGYAASRWRQAFQKLFKVLEEKGLDSYKDRKYRVYSKSEETNFIIEIKRERPITILILTVLEKDMVSLTGNRQLIMTENVLEELDLEEIPEIII